MVSLKVRSNSSRQGERNGPKSEIFFCENYDGYGQPTVLGREGANGKKIPSITNAVDQHRFVMKSRSIHWLAEVGILLNRHRVSGVTVINSGACGLSPFADNRRLARSAAARTGRPEAATTDQ